MENFQGLEKSLVLPANFQRQLYDILLQKYGQEEYQGFTSEKKQEIFENVFIMGMNQYRKFAAIQKSCSLLYNDKPPRADMVQKLGHILFELKKIETFPTVMPLQITNAITRVLSSRDKRTRDKYLQWMRQYANHNVEFNRVDLSELARIFPPEKIVEGGIW